MKSQGAVSGQGPSAAALASGQSSPFIEFNSVLLCCISAASSQPFSCGRLTQKGSSSTGTPKTERTGLPCPWKTASLWCRSVRRTCSSVQQAALNSTTGSGTLWVSITVQGENKKTNSTQWVCEGTLALNFLFLWLPPSWRWATRGSLWFLRWMEPVGWWWACSPKRQRSRSQVSSGWLLVGSWSTRKRWLFRYTDVLFFHLFHPQVTKL